LFIPFVNNFYLINVWMLIHQWNNLSHSVFREFDPYAKALLITYC
jgi:hypothetical protein